MMFGVALTVLLVALGVGSPHGRSPPDTLPCGSSVNGAPRLPDLVPALDSLGGDSVPQRDAALLAPANAAESAAASAYAVVIARFNTLSGAQAWLQSQAKGLPSATFVPVRIQGETWYAALVGSYPTRAEADSLLAALSAQGLSRADSTNIVRAPFAFLVDSVGASAVPGLLKYFADRASRCTRFASRTARRGCSSGAFESPAAVRALRSRHFAHRGITPVLVYRKGRTF